LQHIPELFLKEPKPFYRDESIPLKLSTLMLKLTDPLLTRAESKAISVFRLRQVFCSYGV
jgi:hypothetical protein